MGTRRTRFWPFVPVLSALGLEGCARGVMDPQGPVAEAERLLLIDATAIMLMIVVPVIVATIAFAWWFRASNAAARYQPNWDYSGTIEVVVWAIPALVVLFLGGIGWIAAHALDPKRPIAAAAAPLRVDVVSLDWKWLFLYRDLGVATVNELVVPAGVPIQFRLTSQSVMNSFFVPQLGSQIYTMAGMETGLNLMAARPGVYTGISAQFSGAHFSDMRFRTVALDGAAFGRWQARARAVPDALDARGFQALVERKAASRVLYFGRTTPGLFDAVVMQRPIPATARVGA